MQAYEYILRQMQLEGIGVEGAGSLVRAPGPNAEPIPRCYVAYASNTYHVFLRHDLPPSLVQTLRYLPAERLFRDTTYTSALLGDDQDTERPEGYKSYVCTQAFPADVSPRVICLTTEHQTIDRHPEHWLPDLTQIAVYALIVDGVLASSCCSSREDAGAAEAWVHTHPAYRRRGYARQVTAAWITAIQKQNKLPFYSHRWENAASQAVASSLHLTHFSTGMTYV